MVKKIEIVNYHNYIPKLYSDNNYGKKEGFCRDITFQITEDCCCACTYCYQENKSHKAMNKETAKKAVDLLFNMYYENKENSFINKKTQALVFNFIGGEPLMNIEIIDFICSYFTKRCLETNHPWLYTWRISMISNGKYYFNSKVQDFLKKFKEFISFNITLDGPKEIHNTCRVYHDGTGNFDDAYNALKHYHENFNPIKTTKVTIAKENLKQINEIVKFFVDNNIKHIHANCAYEPEYNIEDGKIFYNELKKMADYLLELNDETNVTLFKEKMFSPKPKTENGNWCGGTGKMLAFGVDGIAYPCIRYMPSSLNKNRKPLECGDVNKGIYKTLKHKILNKYLGSITRRSQSTDECFNCPIASGCSWCSGWNYNKYGTPNKRCTNICVMHKARSLANVYYWNKWYKQNGEDKKMKMWLPKEEALKIIDEAEYNMLLELSKEED